MRAAAFTLLGLALGGCPSDGGNPETLFLAPDGSEVRLRLIDHEPPPF